MYAPACLIVGTRGRSLGGIQGLLPGSVSKYCLQNSPVPVVVVRPKDKREKKKLKRSADLNRRGYSTILDQSDTTGSGAFENLVGQSGGEASEHEAEAVAKAIGLPGAFGDWKGFTKEGSGVEDTQLEGNGSEHVKKDVTALYEDGAPLSRHASVKSDYTESPSPEGPLVIEGPDFEDMPNFKGLGDAEASDDEVNREELEGLEDLSLGEIVDQEAGKGKESRD